MRTRTAHLRATLAAAALTAVAAQTCDVCHLHYFHKDVSSAIAGFNSEVQTCREYKDEACCTRETAMGVGDEQKGYLYPDYTTAGGCGSLTPACEQYFIEEGCFYECDKNLGKWRKHDDCSAEGLNDNGWEIEGMPIKASYCDAWYEACRGANNKLCIGSASEEGKPVYTYFGQPTCATAEGSLGCKQIDEVYTSGKHICETMWGGSFKYEDDTSKDAYVMSFTEGTANPNNDMFTTMDYPPRCTGETGSVNLTAAIDDGCPHNWHNSRQSYTVGEHQNVTYLVTAGAARRFGAAAVALAGAATAVLLA